MNTDDQAIQTLVRTTVSAALNMPCRDAVALLKGLLLLGGEHSSLDPVRAAYVALHETESQLELIAREPRIPR